MINVQLVNEKSLYIFGCESVKVICEINCDCVTYRAYFIDIHEFHEVKSVNKRQPQWRIDGVFHMFRKCVIVSSLLPDYITIQSEDYRVSDLSESRNRVFFEYDLDNSQITDFML